MARTTECARKHDGVQGSVSLLDFYSEHILPGRHKHAAHGTRKNCRIAVWHFERYLGRSPSVDDLTSTHILSLISAMCPPPALIAVAQFYVRCHQCQASEGLRSVRGCRPPRSPGTQQTPTPVAR